LCCPSRTSLLTGMYPQNHGVTNNHAITGGGYEGYMARELDKESWSKLLQPDYYTGFFGKFLNGYLNPASVPVGWDRWYAVYAGAGNMFNWSASHNGIPVVYRGSTDATYSTNVLANLVSITIKQQPIVYKRPFALLFAPIAPHLPARPALEFKGRYAFEPFAPKLKPSFNEPDVSDKPSHIQALPQFTAEEIAVLERDWRLMLESGLSIDKAFQTIWKTLEATGQLANTYIVFASDNGYLWGEHRISNKLYPYRESIKSTMLVWGPGVVPGLDHHIVTNADLFPTFMEIAGKPIPDWVDGRSLLALLRGLTPATWRWQLLVHGNPAESAGRDFHALATGNWTFVQHATEKEFYDLLADPYEVNNAAAALPAAFVTEVEARITNLYNCKGTAVCQPIEDAPLPVR
ncbi:MAG TPA: sulfatase-like hydrolase/transferase, partial [Xanthobacteraceae bacterium]|nr:sulfatase-like hydrolase/transferase [Xanthobacteraceae bacterium]